MKTLIPAVSVAGLAVVVAAAVSPTPIPNEVIPDPVASEPAAERRPVDLVLCLDTSGSMTDLIDSARAKLWNLVNELATTKPTPRLRVGLLTYGSPNNSTARQGWVVRQTDLTSDLDTVYAKMMAMTTHGGAEFVGWVLNDAVHTMSWSPEPDALKLIFVAGNESADQASERHNFRHVAQQARNGGMIINALYAGKRSKGVAEHWDQVAEHGHGHFAAIDMHRGTIQLATPQDKILRELNEELNATYLPYGSVGQTGAANQARQDRNAAKLGAESDSSRTVAKATALYENAAWDLVDASRDKDFDPAELKAEELPENMRQLTPEERRAYLRGMRRARADIQQRIQQVNVARQKHLAAQRGKGSAGQASLGEEMRRAIREQVGRSD